MKIHDFEPKSVLVCITCEFDAPGKQILKVVVSKMILVFLRARVNSGIVEKGGMSCYS